MREGRNWLVISGAQAVVAIGGGLGTLSEIALALKAGKPVIGLGTWEAVAPDGQRLAVIRAATAEEALASALAAAEAGGRASGAPQEESHRRS
jgi:predicted Rossmann-fold nucleotide-binding protein